MKGVFSMDNSITNMKPHLVKEWSERNLPLSPDEVPYGSINCIGGKVRVDTNGKQVQRLVLPEKSVLYAPAQELLQESMI